MKTITLNLDKRLYSGTFFEDLEITLHQEGDQYRPTIHKIHYPTDRRFNPVSSYWTLDNFYEILKSVESYGSLTHNRVPKENLGSFTICGVSELKYVRVDELRNAVVLHSWFYQPLYFIGKFEILPPAIEVIGEVRDYVKGMTPTD